jgi:hypothetical protein
MDKILFIKQSQKVFVTRILLIKGFAEFYIFCFLFALYWVCQITIYHIVTCMSDYRQGLDWWLDFIGLFDTVGDYPLQFTVTHTHTSVPQSVWVSTSHCLVKASNSWCSPSSVFLKYPRPQLLISHSNSWQWLNPSGLLTHSLTHQPTLH